MSVGMRTLYTRVPSWVITTLDKMAADSRVKRQKLDFMARAVRSLVNGRSHTQVVGHNLIGPGEYRPTHQSVAP